MSADVSLPQSADVAIIGGGMVGLSLAAILARCRPSVSIAVVEVMPLAEMAADTTPVDLLPPSFDARASALSESSRRIYRRAGMWQRMADAACPIEVIHVSERDRPGATRMRAGEAGLEGLGYVIENRILGRALLDAVADCDNITLASPLSVERLVPRTDGMEVHAGGGTCTASLVVAAGGAESHLLQTLGIETLTRDYGQTALIANIALDEPHRGVAYERFTDEGPVALLPLPDAGGEHRGALVWTLEPEHATALMNAEEREFLAELHRRFGYRAGRFRRSGVRTTYPLKLMLADEQIRSHLAVVGNAAHSLHPVAGQGFNLALRDVARLAEVVAGGMAAGRPPGELSLLEDYLAGQRRDQRNIVGFSHGLPALFGDDSAATAVLRNTGLIALDLVAPLRREFSRFGAGLLHPGLKLRGPA